MDLEKRISSLSKAEAQEVLKVISAKQIVDFTTRFSNDCSSYNCCPCDTQSGDHCSCNAYCKCTSHAGANLKLMEIYESIRFADRAKVDKLVAELNKTATPVQINTQANKIKKVTNKINR